MRIIRFIDADDAVRWGLEAEDGQASVLTGDLFAELAPTGERVAVKRLLAPLDPTNIFCIGLNYREHAAESGLEPPEQPVVFAKPTSAVCGPGDPILLPACCRRGRKLTTNANSRW